MESVEIAVDLPTRVLKSPNILYQALGEEAVVLNLDNEQQYGLDDVGAGLWQLLDEYKQPAAMIAYILAEYEVDEVVLYRDLAKYFRELQAAGLISVES